MKKYLSLIKASMSEGMNIFKVSTKKKNTFTKYGIPAILTLIIMSYMYFYSETVMAQFAKVKMEYVLLSLFVILTSLMTFIEGIYKSSSLLFNCKDDDLLLSLPISKGTVLFIRVFKFYAFELLFNSIFIIPSIVLYAKNINPGYTYYIVSIIGLLLFPIIPIILSSIIGFILTIVSSKFKGKNKVQTVVAILFLLGIMYFSYNSNGLLLNLAKNASSINDFITKIYYPAGAFTKLVTDFSALKLLEFILINVGAFVISIILLGKFYFRINSNSKEVRTSKKNSKYIIKTSSPTKTLIKKELNRFINSPVFITNAGFGMVLFAIACIYISIKSDSLIDMISKNIPMLSSINIVEYLPLLLFGLLCFSCFMTSITSSMISLEGKSFNILKSLPVKPVTIVNAKVYTAVLFMIPIILVGDIIVFIRFGFKILSVVLILMGSFILPLLSETIGIIVNLKYPKMDAKTDTEVVKQSMSSLISVFIGMGLTGTSIFGLYKMIDTTLSVNAIIAIFVCIYLILYIGLLIYLQKTCDKSFNDIVV